VYLETSKPEVHWMVYLYNYGKKPSYHHATLQKGTYQQYLAVPNQGIALDTHRLLDDGRGRVLIDLHLSLYTLLCKLCCVRVSMCDVP
jgi:hypothetical protein